MRGLAICILATLWVLEVIYWMGRRRHPRETPDHIDRDWRDLAARAARAYPEAHTIETYGNGR